jgi:hypothetical protein
MKRRKRIRGKRGKREKRREREKGCTLHSELDISKTKLINTEVV